MLDRLVVRLQPLARRVYWPLGPKETLAAGVAAMVVAAGLWQTCGISGCPDVGVLTAYQPNGAPVLLDRAGEHFADLAPFERVVVELESLPPHVAQAFLAVEDKRFFRHRGVDWWRVLGAAAANVRSGGFSQGSSTIPMQLARNVFPDKVPAGERTLRRKLLEVRVAQDIEARFEKDEILELYLNHIYFGGGAYGIDAAARRWFDTPATDLSVAQAALLAALPKAPTHYDPRFRPEAARARRDLVIALMEAQQRIDAEAAEEARATRIQVRDRPVSGADDDVVGEWFIDVVRAQLEERFGDRLYRSRMRIHTTMDVRAQRAAEEELTKQLRSLDERVRKGDGPLQGAVVLLDARSGDVLALVGGRDHDASRYNRAVLGKRQVGSAFKPFVYAAAIGEGFPPSQLIDDSPLRMELSRNDVWEPRNYDGRFEGAVSMRQALVRSRNIPTIRLAAAVGTDDVARMAKGTGIEGDIPTEPSMALGTASMSPLELATAYTAFATLGDAARPRFIRRVESASGEVLMETKVERVGAVDPAVAYILTDILRDAVDYGTGTAVRAAGFRGPVAGKTGTTSDATDAWFVGYTPELVGTVWIGYDRPSSIASAATGGGLAAPVWGRMMRRVQANRTTPQPWRRPPGVVEAIIDPESGLVLADDCRPRWGDGVTEIFLAGHLPEASCPRPRYWYDEIWGAISGAFSERDQEEVERARDRIREELERARRDDERVRRREQRERERDMERFLEQRRRDIRNRRGNDGN